MIGFAYDEEADAIYLRLSDEPYSYGKDLDLGRRVDYGVDGNPAGIELLCVSTGVKVQGRPERSRVARLLRSHGIKILP